MHISSTPRADTWSRLGRCCHGRRELRNQKPPEAFSTISFIFCLSYCTFWIISVISTWAQYPWQTVALISNTAWEILRSKYGDTISIRRRAMIVSGHLKASFLQNDSQRHQTASEAHHNLDILLRKTPGVLVITLCFKLLNIHLQRT